MKTMKDLIRMQFEMLTFVFILTLMGNFVNCFNIDTHNYVKHRGNHNSMFGFSVALHREKSNSSLIIGAPMAQTLQPGVTRGGAVYRCDIARDDSCSLVQFDLKGDIMDSEGRQVDMKSYQWFGATVRSSGEDGIVLACAPRYIWFTNHNNRRDPVGTCYVAKNQFTEFSEFSPCRTRNWGYHRQGSCQAGLGASVSRDGRRLYVGAVGSWYWQGQLHSMDAFAQLLFVPPRYTIIEEGQVISQSTHARPDVISTREGPSTDDDSYLGYSVAVGDFGGGSGGFNDVAVGMPRGAGLMGKVVLYNWNMTNLKNFTGGQLGEYFGYSLATCDLDGDKLDDIIVGAPLHTDLSNNKGYYETGRVYILYQGTGEFLWKDIDFRDGINSRSRFGLALTSLGDLNLDGYGDFAVGAPYDGPKEKGAVYIFLGSKRGVREKPSQIIYSEQVSGQPSTFGFSLAGGLDLDENLYPDLLVGAYDSETAVFLRTRPVVRVDASLAFLLPSKQISLEEKNCTLKDRTRVPCVELNTCLNYTGTNVDRRLEFEIQFILDSKKPHSSRLFFLSDENRNIMNQTIRLEKNIQVCKKAFAYIKPNIRDKLTSIEAEMRCSLKGSELSTTRRVARLLQPVLDQTQQDEFYKKDSIIIQKNCGTDNICIPNLRLIATPNVNRYLLGSGDRLEIDVVVQNEGDDAFEAVYQLEVPSGLNYVKFEKVDSGTGKDLLPVLCSPPSYLNNNTLTCDIGNPLPRDKIVHFKVIMQPNRLEGLKPRYEFYMSVNSTNPENSSSLSDNQITFKVPIWVETDLILQGSSMPSDVYYNMSQYPSDENITQESQIGPQVNHIYSIRNKGPSDILEAEAYFLWPSYNLAGEHLFYLLEQPEVTGNVKCQVVEEVNVAYLNMEKRRKMQYDSSLGSAVHSSLTGSGSHSSSSVSSSSSSTSSGGSSTSSSTFTSSNSGHWSGHGSLSDEERRRLDEAARRQKEESGRHRDEWTHHTSNGGSLESDSHSRPQGSHRQTSFEGGRESVSGGSRVESSRTEHSGSRVQQGSDSIFENGRREGYGSSGGVDLGRDIIIDARGSNMGTGSWAGGDSVDISATRIPLESGHKSWYNETRTEHRGSSRYPTESNQGGRWESSHNRGEQDENWRGQYPGSNVTHFEERHFEKNTTWNSNDRRPQVFTNWTINRDGTIESGSHRGEVPFVANKDDSYFVNRGKNMNDSWMISEGNRDRGSSEGYNYRETHNRPVSGSSKNYSEERTTVRNTTWDSHGGPAVTSEHSSWSIDRDGSMRNGSQSRVYHEKDEYGREKTGFYDSSRETADRNSIRGGTGSRTYSEEKETHRNTTWSSLDGKPLTEERRHWRIDQDGVVTSGSSSRTYEADYDNDRAREAQGNHESSRTSSSGSRTSSGSIHEEHRTSGQGSTTSSRRDEFGDTHTSYENSDNRRDQSGSRSSSDDRITHSSREDEERRTSQQSESGSHVATNTNIADLLNNRRNNQGFGNLGEVAAGPRDGVARTYSLDLGILNTGNREASSSRDRNEGNYRSQNSDGNFRSENRGSQSRVVTGHSSSERHGLSNREGDYGSSSSGSRVHTSLSTGERHGSTGGSDHRTSSSGSRVYTSHSSGERHGSSGGNEHRSSSSGSRVYTSQSSGERHGSEGEYRSSNSGSRVYTSQSSGERHGSSEGSDHRSSGFSTGGSRHYEFDSSSGDIGRGSGSVRTETRYSSSRGGGFSGVRNEDDGGYTGHSSSSYERSSSSGSNSGGRSSMSYPSTSGTADGDSSLHGGIYSRRQEHSSSSSSQSSHYATRSRRQVDEVEDIDNSLKCSTTTCIRIRCTVGPLKKDEEANIKFKARAWVQTLKKMAGWNKVNVSSMLLARVSRLPHIGRPDVATTKNLEVVSQMVPRSPPPKPEVVPLWIIVLSACAGAILLMLLVFILYKLGFFKRNRPSNSPEKQPLNRNGHYQPGDEAL